VSLLPFSNDQINKYLQNYATKHGKSVKESWTLLNSMPNVKALAANPFILTRITPILTELHQKNQQLNKQSQQLSRSEVYETFISRWFLEQAERIKGQGYFKQLEIVELAKVLHCYAENLANTCLKGGRLDIEIEENTTLNVNLLQAKYPEQLGLSEKKRQELAQDKEQKALKALRSGCLLKTSSGGFNFFHKSLIEYFAARDLFNGVMSITEKSFRELIKGAHDKEIASFHEQLIDEPQILNLLICGVQKSMEFRSVLWKTIEASKRSAYLSTASANAITLLNLAGESFKGKDFQYARFPKANLEGANLSGANLSYVDASGVNFTNACLLNCNFSSAILIDTVFGQAPQLGYPVNLKFGAFALGIGELAYKGTAISSACFSPDGKQIALMASGSLLRIYNMQTWEQKFVPLQKLIAGGQGVDALCYSPDGNYLFFGVSVPSPIHQPLRYILLDLNNNYHKKTLAYFGQRTPSFGKAHQHNIKLNFSSDSKWCASTHFDDQLKQTLLVLYSSDHKKKINQLVLPINLPVKKLSFSTENEQLLVLHQSENVSLIQAEILIFSLSPFNLISHKKWDKSLVATSWVGKNELKYAVAEQGSISIYLNMKQLWSKKFKNISCLDFLHNTEKLIFATEEKIWQLWDIKEEKFLYSGVLEFIPTALIFNKMENRIAWLREATDNKGHYFELDKEHTSGQSSVWLIEEKITHLRDVASNSPTSLSPNGEYLLTLSGAKSSINTVANLFKLENKESRSLLSQTFNSIQEAGKNYQPLLEQLQLQELQTQAILSPKKDYKAFIKGSTVMVTTQNDEHYAIFNCYKNPPQQSIYKLITLAFSLDSRYLAVGVAINSGHYSLGVTNKCIIQIWSLKDKELYWQTVRKGLYQKISDLTLQFALLNQKNILASFIPKKKIKLFSIEKKTTYLSILADTLQSKSFRNIFAAALSPNGQWIVWSNANNSLIFYSIKVKKIIYEVARAHQATITNILFSADSCYLFSLDINNRQCLWEIVNKDEQALLQLAYTNQPRLNLGNTNITQTLGLTTTQEYMLKQAKSVGEPSDALSYNISSEKKKRDERIKAYGENVKTIFKTDFMINSLLGVVYLSLMKGDVHSFIILEYLDQGHYRCFEKFDFVLDTDKKVSSSLRGFDVKGTAKIRIMSVSQQDIIKQGTSENVPMKKTSKKSKFLTSNDLEKKGYVGVCLGNVTLKQMQYLRACVYRDSNALIKYSRNGGKWQVPHFFQSKEKSYNCFGWCKRILNEAGISLIRLKSVKTSPDLKEKAFNLLADNPKLYLTTPLLLNSEYKKVTTPGP